MGKCGYKTSGTSVIYSPMSSSNDLIIGLMWGSECIPDIVVASTCIVH